MSPALASHEFIPCPWLPPEWSFSLGCPAVISDFTPKTPRCGPFRPRACLLWLYRPSPPSAEGTAYLAPHGFCWGSLSAWNPQSPLPSGFLHMFSFQNCHSFQQSKRASPEELFLFCVLSHSGILGITYISRIELQSEDHVGNTSGHACVWLLGGTVVKRFNRSRFDPWVRKIPWRRKWQPTPVFLPGEFHAQRNLTGYNPWGCRVRYDWVTKHACM